MSVLHIRNWNTLLILTSFYKKLVQISHSKSGFLYVRIPCIRLPQSYLVNNAQLVIQSAENRRKSVTDSGYAYVTQWF